MRSVFHPSIRLKLAGFVAILVLILTGALSWGGFLFARTLLRQQIDERLAVAVSDRQAMLLSYIRQQQERVTLVASRTRLRQLLEDHTTGKIAVDKFQTESRRILDDAKRNARGFLAIWIADPKGKVVTATGGNYPGKNFATDPYFKRGLHEEHMGVPYITKHYGGKISSASYCPNDCQRKG